MAQENPGVCAHHRPYDGGGSGIGLSLSRQIMRAHGGSLSVASSPENGTTFSLRF